ncbi:GNAT family N-acetyltransferase [Chitinimonas lacunae]|uniref:GNAT family N-acetyltransferase n=1 Tax=Chitinimonas lacunae TaxID=1963018 RepID=A0ABV8MI80_9NEIS
MSPAHPVYLETPRLLIRSLEDTDLDTVFDIYQDPDIQRFTPADPWQDRASALLWLERNRERTAAGTARQCVLIRREDQRLIGTCVLFRIDPTARSCELGYTLEQSARGYGYMNEALRVLINHAFDTTVLNRIEARISPDNAASAGVLKRLGFQQEGLLRQCSFFNGEIADSMIFGLLREDWRALAA